MIPSEYAGAAARLVFVDDDLDIMRCVGHWLERHEGFRVVDYAHHAQLGLAMAQEHLPDLVVSDIHMAGADPFIACRRIIESCADRVRVLFYTSHPRDQYLDRAIAAGASGMVCKHGESLHDLALAIRHVLRGQVYFSPQLAKRLVELEGGAPRSRVSALSHRELEVIHMLADGETNREIAMRLGTGLRTIEKIVAEIKLKLDLATTNELLIFAAREGLVHGALPAGV